jgi:hypothetical protein
LEGVKNVLKGKKEAKCPKIGEKVSFYARILGKVAI